MQKAAVLIISNLVEDEACWQTKKSKATGREWPFSVLGGVLLKTAFAKSSKKSFLRLCLCNLDEEEIGFWQRKTEIESLV